MSWSVPEQVGHHVILKGSVVLCSLPLLRSRITSVSIVRLGTKKVEEQPQQTVAKWHSHAVRAVAQNYEFSELDLSLERAR